MPIVAGTAILIGAGIAAATAGGTAAIRMIPTKSEKRLKADLEAMEERFAAGDIGLSAAEEAKLTQQGLSAIQAAEREYLARETELAALTGVTGGQLVAQQRAAQDRMARERGRVGEQIRDIEMEQRARDLEQLRLLQQAQQAVEDKRTEEAAALVSEIGDIASTSFTSMGLSDRFTAPREGYTPPSMDEEALERLFAQLDAEKQAQQSLPLGSF